MARYHMIVNSGTIPVYRRSDCSGPCGELYPGEVFVNLGVTTGYLNVNEVRFIDPDGRYTLGFINSYDGSYGNIFRYFTKYDKLRILLLFQTETRIKHCRWK